MESGTGEDDGDGDVGGRYQTKRLDCLSKTVSPDQRGVGGIRDSNHIRQKKTIKQSVKSSG